MQILKMSNAESLVGKTIRIKAKGYKANHKVDTLCKVLSVDLGKRKPFVTELIESAHDFSHLDHAFRDDYATEDNDKPFSIGDNYQYVKFEIVE